MSTTGERTFGGQTLVAPLRRVLVRAPDPADLERWREFGWLAEPDPAIAAKQHGALCEVLRGAGAEVVYAEGDVAGDPDAISVFDPVIVSDRTRRVPPPAFAALAPRRRPGGRIPAADADPSARNARAARHRAASRGRCSAGEGSGGAGLDVEVSELSFGREWPGPAHHDIRSGAC